MQSKHQKVIKENLNLEIFCINSILSIPIFLPSAKQIHHSKVSKSSLAKQKTSGSPKADKGWNPTKKSQSLSPNAKSVQSKPLKNSGKTHDRIPTSQKNTTLGNSTQGTFRGPSPYPQQTYYAPPASSGPSNSSSSHSSHPSPARPSAKSAGPNVGWQPASPSVSKPGLRSSYPSYPTPSPNAKPAPKGLPVESKPLQNSGKTHDRIPTSQKNTTLGNSTQGTFRGPQPYPQQTYYAPPASSGPSNSSSSHSSHPSPARPSAKSAGPNVGWQPASPSVSKPGLRSSYPSYPTPSPNAKPAPKGLPVESKPLQNSGKTHDRIPTSQKNTTLGNSTQGTFRGPQPYPQQTYYAPPASSGPSNSSSSHSSHPSPARPSAKSAGPNVGWQPASPSVSKPGLRSSYPSYPTPSPNAKPAPKGLPVESKPLQNSGKTHDRIPTSQKNTTLGNSTQGTFRGPQPYPQQTYYPGPASPASSRPSNSSSSHSSHPSPSLLPSPARPSAKSAGPNVGWHPAGPSVSKPGLRPSYPSYPSPSPKAKPAPKGLPVESKPLLNSGKTHDRIPTSQKNTTLGNSTQGPPKPSYDQGKFRGPPSASSHPSPSPTRSSAKPEGPNVGSQPAGSSVSKPALRPNAKPAPKGSPVKSKPLKNSGKTHGSILTSQKKTTSGNAPQGPPKLSYTQGTFQGNPPFSQQTYYPGHAPPAYPGHYPPSNTGRKDINNNWIGYPSYHYQRADTGSTSLGFYLGYTLGRVKNPTYYYSHNSYDGYRPRYDHYTVHHYYHNNNETIIGRERIIEPNTVVGCVGDSGSICPANTRSLCTDQGVIMCVALISATVPCKDEKDTNCVTSTIPCVNSEDPKCKGNPQKFTTVSIPCISTAKIYGTVTYVDNTIIVESFLASRPARSVLDNVTDYPTTTDAIPITTYPSSTTNITQTTTVDLMTTYPSTTTHFTQTTTPATTIIDLMTTTPATTFIDLMTTYPSSTTNIIQTTTPPTTIDLMTTYPSSTTNITQSTTPTTTIPNSTTSVPKILSTEEPQNYCVTIMAVPDERKPTKGEVLFDEVEHFVDNFLVKSFGL
ncbi:unnamed protein product [Brassicogethes aeneus]|uniref:Uncharacterized protein n=1 Tax=Brassicogethes aeneus TaxID=1431903 RepID=A0A9P0B6E5_BRAAE|nr:unnamed protein product [Brassicogethes aeneus]